MNHDLLPKGGVCHWHLERDSQKWILPRKKVQRITVSDEDEMVDDDDLQRTRLLKEFGKFKTTELKISCVGEFSVQPLKHELMFRKLSLIGVNQTINQIRFTSPHLKKLALEPHHERVIIPKLYLPNLEALLLSNCNLQDDMDFLDSLPKLKRFDLHHSDILPTIPPQLIQLEISEIPQMINRDFPDNLAILHINQLDILHIRARGLKKLGFSNSIQQIAQYDLPSLQQLHFSNPRVLVTGPFRQPIRKLTIDATDQNLGPNHNPHGPPRHPKTPQVPFSGNHTQARRVSIPAPPQPNPIGPKREFPKLGLFRPFRKFKTRLIRKFWKQKKGDLPKICGEVCFKGVLNNGLAINHIQREQFV
jgi:hypothetical protein